MALDFAAINARLIPALPVLVARWLPGGRLNGREWTVRNPRRYDRRAGSFRVNVATGRWADFAAGARGGDPVSLYAYLFTAGQQGEAARELAQGGSAQIAPRVPAAANSANPAKAGSPDALARIAKARTIYAGAGPIGSAGERYLDMRGLRPSSDLESVREALLPYMGSGSHPALVVPVRGISGCMVGVQRTYLTPGGAKLPVASPKLSLGVVRGGAIRLGDPGAELILCEGLEDGLSIIQALDGAAVWVAAGAGMLAAMELPGQVRRVVIAADNDAPGEAAAQRAAETFTRQGRRVRIMRPAAAFKDWNDQLRGGTG